VTDLLRAVHDALTATAVRRDPDPATLPPAAPAPPATVPLPVPPRPAGDVGDVIARRRSAYAFGPQPALDDLAAVLHHGVAAAPRAGGLPSLVPYVVARGPGPLAPGVHRADLRLPVPGLVAVRAGDPTPYVAGSLDQPPFATRAPLWLALVADVAATRAHYPARHYRTLHLDAGAALQNALLVATAVGLAACPVMGFDDAAWSRLVCLDADAFPAVLVALGSCATPGEWV
jgi:SagB-type dehydrogenase family enzyme